MCKTRLDKNGIPILGRRHNFSRDFKIDSSVSIVRRKSFSKHKRFALWLRDFGLCHYCAINLSLNDFTVDHIVPISKGGTNMYSNLVISCEKCNVNKDDTPYLYYIKTNKIK